MKRALALIAAAIALWLAACPAFAEPPMWVVEAKGARIVLFGSVHLLSHRSDGWRTPALQAELSKARSIWLEIPFDDAARAEASKAAAANGLLPAGQTLRSQLTPDVRARLERVAATLGLDLAVLDRLRPWLAEVMITTAQAVHDGARESLGVETQLLAVTPPEVTRRAFETPAQQIGFFSGAAMSDQIASLADTLRQIEEEPGAFAKLEKAWTEGDVDDLVAEAVEPLKIQAPGLYERLVVARNRRWVSVIEGLLKHKERAFIVVGVGHLVGTGGVPALLRAKGFQVEGP